MTPRGRGGSARVPARTAREGGAGGLAAVAGEGAGGAGGGAGGRRREGRGEAAGDRAEAGERGEGAVAGEPWDSRGTRTWVLPLGRMGIGNLVYSLKKKKKKS